LEPSVTGPGRRDFRHLIGLLEAPLAAQHEWLRPALPVYHLVSRAAPEDRILSDAEWAVLATEMLHNISLSRREEPEAGVRWIAVRHADDHIHIVATLARQDGRIARRDNDYYRVRGTCRIFEQRYQLRRTAPADSTAARRPHRAELEKARRAGRHETVRDRLRHEVRSACAVAVDEADFLGRLRAAGVMVRLRRSTVDATEVTGYAVTLPGVRAADGTPVWYGGGRLAADLTLPRLRQRWRTSHHDGGETDHRQPPLRSSQQRRQAIGDATAAVMRATDGLRQAIAAGTTDTATATANAAADALTVTARLVEGRRSGPLTHAADQLDHAARRGRCDLETHYRSDGLHASARLIATLRRLHPYDEVLQAAELISRLAALADTIATWRRHQGRSRQAVPARRAAAGLRDAVAGLRPRPGSQGVAAPKPRPQPGLTVGVHHARRSRH
jgi:hypothetical protein